MTACYFPIAFYIRCDLASEICEFLHVLQLRDGKRSLHGEDDKNLGHSFTDIRIILSNDDLYFCRNGGQFYTLGYNHDIGCKSKRSKPNLFA